MNENQQKLCGFLVVRKPNQYFDEQNRGAYSDTLYQVNGIHYAGIHRMEWFDVVEDFYTGKLPETLKTAYQQVINGNYDFTGINLSRDYTQTKKLLDYSNKNHHRNEIIALYSSELAEYKGEFIVETSSWELLGFDYMAMGQGSLIDQGIFQLSTLFGGWVKHLNGNGLFNSADLLEDYVEFCLDAVEVLDIVTPFEYFSVEVYRVVE